MISKETVQMTFLNIAGLFSVNFGILAYILVQTFTNC